VGRVDVCFVLDFWRIMNVDCPKAPRVEEVDVSLYGISIVTNRSSHDEKKGLYTYAISSVPVYTDTDLL
jgi:hypothetical protein